MLRRASGSLLPLAIRSVGSPRAFHGAVVNPKKDTLAPNFNGASSPRFSTLAKPNSDQELAQEPHKVETMADGFPFKIQNSENAITMLREWKHETKEWKDETFTLKVAIPQDVGFNMLFRAVYSATLTICKGGKYLEFDIRIAPDKLSLKSLTERYIEDEAESIVEAEALAEADSDSDSGYEAKAETESESDTDSYCDYEYKYYQCGMDYCLLDETDYDHKYFEMHWGFRPYSKSLKKFLKRRGITLKFTNYLHDYITTHMRKRRCALQDLVGEP